MHLQPVVKAPRECPEAVLGSVMPLYGGVEVVRILLAPRLIGQLGAETSPRREDRVEHARGETLVDDQSLGATPRDEVTRRVLSGVQDYVRHGLGLVDRRYAYRLDA